MAGWFLLNKTPAQHTISLRQQHHTACNELHKIAAWPSHLRSLQSMIDPRRSTRIPNWALAVGLCAFAGATYFYVLKQVGPNLNQQLEEEAARQEQAERARRQR